MAIVRNLTLIKCTPGYPMSMGHTTVFGGAGTALLPVIVEGKRFASELPVARVRTQNMDLPTIVSALPHERRT